MRLARIKQTVGCRPWTEGYIFPDSTMATYGVNKAIGYLQLKERQTLKGRITFRTYSLQSTAYGHL